MTDTSLSHLPLMAGGAVASSAGRAGLWALAHYRRAPLAATAITAMTALSLIGAAHALYFEPGPHPAPLFAAAAPAVPAAKIVHKTMHKAPAPAHQRPAPRSRAEPAASPASRETTGSVAPAPAKPDIAPVIGNDDVAAIQEKLAKLNFFKGTVDGYYGPRTADAIRAFEDHNGMKPVGSLSPDVMQAIRAAPLETPATRPVSAPVPVPMPAFTPAIDAKLVSGDTAEAAPPPVAPAVDPMATASVRTATPEPDLHPRRLALAPEPPAPAPAAAAIAQPDVKLGPVKSPATRLLDAAGETAADAFDAVASAIEDMGDDRSATASARTAAPARRPQVTATIAARPATRPVNPNADSTNPVLVSRVQRGLASLGFLAGQTDGVADEATAKAIRNFQVYYDYPVTGRVTPELLSLLQHAGAQT